MRSTCEKGIEATFCQVDQRLPKITFDPMNQKWSYFMFVYIKIVSEIEVIAPPSLAEAFQTK